MGGNYYVLLLFSCGILEMSLSLSACGLTGALIVSFSNIEGELLREKILVLKVFEVDLDLKKILVIQENFGSGIPQLG